MLSCKIWLVWVVEVSEVCEVCEEILPVKHWYGGVRKFFIPEKSLISGLFKVFNFQ